MTMFTKIETITTIDYLAVARVASNAQIAVADPKELGPNTRYCKCFDESTFEQQSVSVEVVEQICNIVYTHQKNTDIFYAACKELSNRTWAKRGWKYGETFNLTHRIDNTLTDYHKCSNNEQLQIRVYADTIWNIVRSLPLDVFPHLKR